MKKAVYTALCGDRDTPKPLTKKNPNWDYIFFTDNPDLKVDGWEMRLLVEEGSPRMVAKLPKLLPHKYLPEYKRTMWVDAAYEIVGDPEWINAPCVMAGFSAAIHPSKRVSVYEEAETILKYGFDDSNTVATQINRYKQQGFDGCYRRSIFQLGVILRTNEPTVNQINEDWYNEVVNGSIRDQLSLPYVLFKNKDNLPIINRMTQDHIKVILKWHPHYKNMNNIFFISPYGFRLKIGDRLNYEIDRMPENAWIALTDQDCCALIDKFGDLLNDTINRYPDTDLFSCYTNRLGLKYQIPEGVNIDDYNLMNHHQIAQDLLKKNYSTCSDIDKPVAGFFMLFPKRTWAKYNFQSDIIDMEKKINDRRGVYFDWDFSDRILKGGGKIRLMEGLYMFHAYRLGKHIKDVTHLTNIV